MIVKIWRPSIRPTLITILLTASACGAGPASFGESVELPAVAGVTVRRETLTLPHYVKTVVPGTEDRKRPELRTHRVADKNYRALLLENEYLKIQIVPELGGVIYRAVFKPTGDDLFYYEPAGKQWYVFWEGGVKASFPWAEHGLVGWGQPASCRVYRRDDGTTTIALWMEFSRHIEHNRHGSLDCVGGYSVCLLSQLVTLRPGEGSFSITYRLTNPSPWRQGRRLWNDAFLPRNHTDQGAVQGFELPPKTTTTELILPCSYVSYHCGQRLRRWDPANAKIGARPDAGDSIFPWDVPFGFAGAYYPDVRVNRLRLTDPAKAPGAKIYLERGEPSLSEGGRQLRFDSNYNYIELWGGTDSVFEGVENWLGPGECFDFTHTFALARGIGKVSFADERLAVSVDFDAPQDDVGVVTWGPVRELTASLDGKPLTRSDANGPGCAVDCPATFELPSGSRRGTLTVTADGKELLCRKFPLKIPDDTSGHERILEGLKAPGEMRADQRDRNWGQAGARQCVGRYPRGSTARGRVLYRLGHVDDALACLREATVTSPADGEAFHLLGAALLEKRQAAEAAAAFDSAVKARESYPPARFYRAVIALSGGDNLRARRELTALIETIPAHWEARLLRAWIGDNVAEARRLEAEDPADPRAAWVLLCAAQKSGDAETRTDAQQALNALLKEPGAARRLSEFKALTEGRFQPPARLESASSKDRR